MCASIFAKDREDGRWWSIPPTNVTFEQTKRYTAMRVNMSGLWKQNGFSHMPQVQGISCCQVVLPRARKKKLLREKNNSKKYTSFVSKTALKHLHQTIQDIQKASCSLCQLHRETCQNNYLNLFKSFKLENILRNKPCYKTLWQTDRCTSNMSQKSI